MGFRAGVLAAIALALAVVGAETATGEPPDDRVQAVGAVAPGEEEFTSFHLTARETNGVDRGEATFFGVAVAGGRLVVDITCVRVTANLDTEGDTRHVAVMTGPVVFAENGVGIGRPAIIGVRDGGLSTPLIEPDAINTDFALDMPSFVTCENAGLSVETLLIRGHVTIR